MEVRPGGASHIVMSGPNGEEHPSRGTYLEVIANEKLVFTDAFVKAWEPSGKAFMVGTITFEDAPDGKTKYVACVDHWNAQDRETHEKMGFHEGWGAATSQLEELARLLP